jgi:hypothetical protein
MRYRYSSTLLIAASLLIGVLALFSRQVAAQGPEENRVGLVVQSAEGAIITRCLTISSPTVTGRQVLEQAELKLQIDENNAVGVTICKIEDIGCDFPAEPCFCDCQGAECRYWNYLRISKDSPEEAWAYSPLGAAASTVYPGEVEGWAWGKTPAALPTMTFHDVCPPIAAASASPTGVVLTSSTGTSKATAKTSPSETPRATATPAAASGGDNSILALAAAVLLVLVVAILTRRRR